MLKLASSDGTSSYVVYTACPSRTIAALASVRSYSLTVSTNSAETPWWQARVSCPWLSL